MKRRALNVWIFLLILTAATLFGGVTAQGAEYKIDSAHSFVEFRIQHLGFSWLYGRFNTVSGEFSHNPAEPESNRIEVAIDTGSIDTRHAERDKHLRSKDFLDVKKYPMATFKSTGYSGNAREGSMEGVLTLHGVSRPITIKVKKIGEGKDPWKGHRAGFTGTMKLKRSHFGISYNLGPASETMEMELGIEGIRQ